MRMTSTPSPTRFPGAIADALPLTVLLGVLWLALAGGRGLVFGAVAVPVTVALSRWLVPMQYTHFALAGLVRFVPWFLVQSLAGGVDVARRALHPRLPLDICEIDHALSLPPGQARSVFVGVISLLPGTLACDVHGDRLRVHSLIGDPRAPLAALERRIAALYGLNAAQPPAP
jgi:multicomponent Na+:H+ antiporter subunit E